MVSKELFCLSVWVVYLCIIFVSMHNNFALPGAGWRRECILKKRGLVISDWYFGEGMEMNSEGKKVKKVQMTTFLAENN